MSQIFSDCLKIFILGLLLFLLAPSCLASGRKSTLMPSVNCFVENPYVAIEQMRKKPGQMMYFIKLFHPLNSPQQILSNLPIWEIASDFSTFLLFDGGEGLLYPPLKNTFIFELASGPPTWSRNIYPKTTFCVIPAMSQILLAVYEMPFIKSLSKSLYLFWFYMWVVVCMCDCVPRVCSTLGGQKRVLYHPVLEL